MFFASFFLKIECYILQKYRKRFFIFELVSHQIWFFVLLVFVTVTLFKWKNRNNVKHQFLEATLKWNLRRKFEASLPIHCKMTTLLRQHFRISKVASIIAFIESSDKLMSAVKNATLPFSVFSLFKHRADFCQKFNKTNIFFNSFMTETVVI